MSSKFSISNYANDIQVKIVAQNNISLKKKEQSIAKSLKSVNNRE
jgi:hypothetical protein